MKDPRLNGIPTDDRPTQSRAHAGESKPALEEPLQLRLQDISPDDGPTDENKTVGWGHGRLWGDAWEGDMYLLGKRGQGMGNQTHVSAQELVYRMFFFVSFCLSSRGNGSRTNLRITGSSPNFR